MATDEDVMLLAEGVGALRVSIDAEREAKRRGNRILLWGVAVLMLVGWGLVVLFAFLRSGVNDTKHIAKDTNRLVGETVVDRDARIENLETLIYQATWVLTDQAVPALTGMCEQIKSLGGECPTVILDPEKAPKR